MFIIIIYQILFFLFQLKMWPGLSEAERMTTAQQEENAVQNQLLLFINRIIALRTPLEAAAGKKLAGTERF